MPPVSVLLEPVRASRHALEWSRDDKPSRNELASRNEPIWETTSRHAAQHMVPRVRRDLLARGANQRALRPLRLTYQDVRSLAEQTLDELERTKRATRAVDALPQHLPLPTLAEHFDCSVRPKRLAYRRRILPPMPSPLDERPMSVPNSPSPPMARPPSLRAARLERRGSAPAMRPSPRVEPAP